jgi:hypothetical protein
MSQLAASVEASATPGIACVYKRQISSVVPSRRFTVGDISEISMED